LIPHLLYISPRGVHQNCGRPKLCFKSGKFILQVTEYTRAARIADEAIAEAVGRYLHEAMLEEEERQEGSEGA
jgi:hypothetical protein